MGRASLDLALTQKPELRELLATLERDLERVLDLLRPYESAGKPPDPDLRFQVRILQQTLQEVSWMLRPN